jgi:hypothetical protein
VALKLLSDIDLPPHTPGTLPSLSLLPAPL